MRHPRKVPGKEWLLFGILVWLCILTRHINATLAGLMPLAFFVLGVTPVNPDPIRSISSCSAAGDDYRQSRPYKKQHSLSPSV